MCSRLGTLVARVRPGGTQHATGPRVLAAELLQQRPLGLRVTGRRAIRSGPALDRAAQRRRPAPPNDALVRARNGAPAGTDQPRKAAGRVYCGYSSRPSTNDSSDAEATLPITPGTSRVTASITTSAGGFPTGEHVVADGQLAVAEVVRHPLVDAFVAAAQQREPVGGRELARDAVGRSDGRSATGGRAVGAVAIASTAAKIGSRHQHHSRAAAERPVVDGAVRIVGPLARVVHTEVDDSVLACALPTSETFSGPARYSGNSENTSIRTRHPLGMNRPLGMGRLTGRAGRRAGRPDHPRGIVRRRRPSGSTGPRRARAGRARGSPRPRPPGRSCARRGRCTSAPMTSCTHTSPSGASADASARERRAAQRLGRIAVVEADEPHEVPALVRP